jgi:purine-binding chemotaxis protein CheW
VHEPPAKAAHDAPGPRLVGPGCRVEGREITMGVLVDRVLEVAAFGAEAIDPAPILGEGAAGGDLFLGVGRASRRVVFLLDAAAILSAAEAGLLSTMGDAAASQP